MLNIIDVINIKLSWMLLFFNIFCKNLLFNINSVSKNKLDEFGIKSIDVVD